MPASNIDPGNEALKFIDLRITDDEYRGLHHSQHNRYSMEQIVSILKLFDVYAPNYRLMKIRTADISKRPENTPDEFDYAKFCDKAKELVGIGTQDAMRKNLFVDLHRMGLIRRYDKNSVPLDPFSRSAVKFVSLSHQGSKLVNSVKIVDRYYIFSKAIDTLLQGSIDIILNILRDQEYGIGQISISEYMFFVSAIGTNSKFNITTTQAIELIKSYRLLSRIQQRSVLVLLKSELNPDNFIGSKIQKRDFHNWRNEAQQVFNLLGQTIYFEVRGEQLVLNGRYISEYDRRPDRSLSEKYQYFVNHKVSKTTGFELHHVVPLAWSESPHHFKMLDKWENMVYVDAFSHAKITQNRNKNVVMNIYKDDVVLADFMGNEVYLKYKNNILYKTSNQSKMKEYNNELLITSGE